MDSAGCCRPVVFRPAHEQKLANEFLLYTDVAAAAEDLGGWDLGLDEPTPAVAEGVGKVVFRGEGLEPSHALPGGPVECTDAQAARAGGVIA